MSFHNFYSYSLSEDDIDSLNYLLYNFLKCARKNEYKCRNLKDFVFFLLFGGLKENDALNLLIEAMYYLPRRDILYECSINYDDCKDCDFGKFINFKRILLFQIFNESNEEEFNDCLNKLIIMYGREDNCAKNLNVFENMETLLEMWTNNVEMKKSFEYLRKYDAESKIPDIIYQFSKYDQTQSCELQVPNQVESKSIYVTLEKGDESCDPKFLHNSGSGPRCFDYNANDVYPYPENDEISSVCIIFNIRNYENRIRRGSEHDVELIRKTFENLHFSTWVFEDKTKKEIFEIAEIYANVEVNRAGSMLVCFILAHGEKDYIFDINEQLVNFRELSMVFSARNCEAYQGKPKIFFIQACQGPNLQEGIPTTEQSTEEYTVPQIEQDGVSKAEIKRYKKYDSVPEEADFVMGMSTVPNCVSFRSVKKGSWYITELCKLIDTESSKKDLISILTSVNYAVSQKQYGKTFCQLPVFCSTAMKKCYLKMPNKSQC